MKHKHVLSLVINYFILTTCFFDQAVLLLREILCRSLFRKRRKPAGLKHAGTTKCRRIFGERTISTSLRNLWPPSWILKAEESWGEKETSTKGVVDKREGRGRGRGRTNSPKSNMANHR